MEHGGHIHTDQSLALRECWADGSRNVTMSDTPTFPSRMTTRYSPGHEMDAQTRRPGDDHQRQVRRLERHTRGQRVPEERGLPGRVG